VGLHLWKCCCAKIGCVAFIAVPKRPCVGCAVERRWNCVRGNAVARTWLCRIAVASVAVRRPVRGLAALWNGGGIAFVEMLLREIDRVGLLLHQLRCGGPCVGWRRCGTAVELRSWKFCCAKLSVLDCCCISCGAEARAWVGGAVERQWNCVRGNAVARN
jgi:hypothetical protein